MNDSEPKYSIEVYEDYAVIKGFLSTDILTLLIRLCKKEGFTRLGYNHDGQEFKLVRGSDEK